MPNYNDELGDFIVAEPCVYESLKGSRIGTIIETVHDNDNFIDGRGIKMSLLGLPNFYTYADMFYTVPLT
jgi:hypothetical protein